MISLYLCRRWRRGDSLPAGNIDEGGRAPELQGERPGPCLIVDEVIGKINQVGREWKESGGFLRLRVERVR
jgi:hypothetical protein